MCGIAGIWHQTEARPDVVHAMTDALAHRGPDADGYWHDATCALGHRRLKIVDLRDEANQPMVSANKDWVLVYNGEVYNYKTLRQTELPHCIFRNTSDTEVLLEGFAQFGPAFVQKLEGMFALALYQVSTATLWLMRDSAGIKPLIYAHWTGGVAFGSEIKALLQIPHLDLSLDLVAIEQYLQLGYIPSPLTVYRSVKKLPPGHVLRINKEGSHLYPFLQQSAQRESSPVVQTIGEATSLLQSALRKAVQRQLVADVPVGVFLSGGLDSTTIAAIASEQSVQRINTFSIGTGSYESSELPYARTTANALGTNHTEYMLESDAIKHWLGQLQLIYDEPYADSSSIPTLLIAQLSRKTVTVALSGDGGDELFMGYGLYQWAARRMNPALFAAGRLLGLLPDLFGKGKLGKLRDMMATNATLEQAHLFTVEHGFFTTQEARDWLVHIQSEPFIYPDFQPVYEHPEENQALFDRCYYLPDDLLKKVDRASMRHGLEVRVPMLDEDVQRAASAIPFKFKVCEGRRKYVLQEVLRSYLPEYPFARPKRGFSIPLHEWFRSDLAYLIDQWLAPDQVRTAGIVHPHKVADLVNRFRLGATHLYSKVWLLIVLHQFMHKYRSHTPV